MQLFRNISKSLAFCLILITFFSLSTLISYAEETKTVECFDYYKFGSVDVQLSAPTNLFPSGANISLDGTITNSNPYPIVEGSVYAKVYRLSNEGEIIDTVDFFLAQDNIHIHSESTISADIKWKVPNHLTSGKFKLVTYFTTSQKFNLQGLTFTDDISGGEVFFEVGGDAEGSVYFDRSSVQLDGEQYVFSSFSPTLSETTKDKYFTSKIINTTSSQQDITISSLVYKWDSIDNANLVETQTRNIKVDPGNTTSISFPVKNYDFPVYFVVTTLEYKDTKSILGIRYIVDEKQHYRLNFPTLLNFPLDKSRDAEIVSCFHGMGMGSGFAGHRDELGLSESSGMGKLATFETSLLDLNNQVIATTLSHATVTDQMSAIKTNLPIAEEMDSARLQVKMIVDGKLYDEVNIKYSCLSIDESLCNSLPKDNRGIFQKSNLLSVIENSTLLKVVIFLVLMLLVILSIIIYRRFTRNVLLVLFFVSGVLSQDVQAETMTWTGTTPEMCDESIFGRITDAYKSRGECNLTFSKVAVTVKNNFYVKNKTTGKEIACGSTVPEGTDLEFAYDKLTGADICWNGTGGHIDTPCGEWNAKATRAASLLCEKENFIRYYAGGDGYPKVDAYLQITGATPARTVKLSAAAGSACSGTGTPKLACDTANASGALRVSFAVPATYAKFYSGVIHRDIRSYNGKITIPESVVDVCRGTTFGATRDRPKLDDTQYKMSALPEYKLTIPAKSQSCTINISNPNGAPSVSIVNTEDTLYCSVDTSLSISLESTDPDNDQVRYIVDWGGGLPVETFPSTGHVPAGPYSISRTFITPGPRTIQVRAEDTSGAVSNPASYTLNCDGSCTVTNACGKQVSGTLNNNVCSVPNSANINNSCIESFSCHSAVNANGSATCKWQMSELKDGITSTCGFVDLTTLTPRPIPGLQNLDPNQSEATIRNIQTTTRFCLVCQFYDAIKNQQLPEAVQHQWIKVIRIGEE